MVMTVKKHRLFYWLVCAIVLFSVTLSACSRRPEQGIGVSYPEFSRLASEEPFRREDVSFDIAESDIANLDRSVKVYCAKALTVDDAYTNKILEAFGFVEYHRQVGEGNVTNYTMDNKRISIRPNGVFTFETTYDTERTDSPFDLENDAVGRNAKKFLESYGLLPSGFALTDRFGEQGVSYEENGVKQTVITAKGAWFQREIDGIEVVGTSKILVMFNTDGVCSVTSAYSEIGESVEVTLIDMEEAIERAKSGDCQLTWEIGKLQGQEIQAVVDRVKIVYYDDPLDEKATHIQPCYYFEGTAKDESGNGSAFSILVPALEKENYLST